MKLPNFTEKTSQYEGAGGNGAQDSGCYVPCRPYALFFCQCRKFLLPNRNKYEACDYHDEPNLPRRLPFRQKRPAADREENHAQCADGRRVFPATAFGRLPVPPAAGAGIFPAQQGGDGVKNGAYAQDTAFYGEEFLKQQFCHRFASRFAQSSRSRE